MTIEAVLRGTRAGESVVIEAAVRSGDREARMVRLWPSAAPGVFTGRTIAPAAEGASMLSVSAQTGGRALRAEAPFFVTPQRVPEAGPASAPVLLASTHGGEHIEAGDVAALNAALTRAFPGHRAPATIRPMRYAWWLLPFTLLLGYEWRWRRQHGLK